MIEVFKILKYYDSDPNQILQRHTSSATRGHSLKLAKKQSNSNLRLYSFSIRVINNWNNLSNHVLSSSNTNTFKNRLDSYWKYHPARYDWEASDYFHPSSVYSPYSDRVGLPLHNTPFPGVLMNNYYHCDLHC